MHSRLSRNKIAPFIRDFSIDTHEFLDPPESFHCFNDFFIRKLKAAARPIDMDPDSAVIPADGRYLFFETIDQFHVKGQTFDLKKFLRDDELAERYQDGSMVVARLCPTDYHRYHFPCNSLPSEAQLINGYLYSVNPIAIKQNLSIFWENKRVITELATDTFGTVLFVEIGATSVGSIHQTYREDHHYAKGDEKGYFSFGGSCIVLLFEKGSITFCDDLLAAAKEGYEVKCLMGQPLGKGSTH